MIIRPELKFKCGDVVYTVSGNSTDYLRCPSPVKIEHGTVRNIADRLWSVCWVGRDYDAGWGEPKFYVEWEPVDKGYSKTMLVDDLLKETRRSFLS